MKTLMQEALQKFANTVAAKMNQLTSGEPEDQLRNPFEDLMRTAAATMNLKV